MLVNHCGQFIGVFVRSAFACCSLQQRQMRIPEDHTQIKRCQWLRVSGMLSVFGQAVVSGASAINRRSVSNDSTVTSVITETITGVMMSSSVLLLNRVVSNLSLL